MVACVVPSRTPLPGSPRTSAESAKPRRKELEFLPAALEVTETPAHPLARGIAMALCAFMIIAVAWAWIGKVDITAVAQGKVIPTGRVKVIQPRELGVVRAIHVTDGQTVRAGETLIELDPTESAADETRRQSDLALRFAQMARPQALTTDPGRPDEAWVTPAAVSQDQIDVQWQLMWSQANDYAARMAAHDKAEDERSARHLASESTIARIEAALPLINERTEAYRILADKGLFARTGYLALEQERVELEGDLATELNRRQEAAASLAAITDERNQTREAFRTQLLAELAQAETEAEAIRQEIVKADQRNGLRQLIAPTDGVVQQLAVHTIGGVVTAAEPLMVIVPRDGFLEIEAQVLNKDIGFVEPSQPVEIKLEAFPFTRYGTIGGMVASLAGDAVADDALGPVYTARIHLAAATIEVDGRTVDIAPSMNTTVEIKTGQRRIAEFLLAPLLRYRDETYGSADDERTTTKTVHNEPRTRMGSYVSQLDFAQEAHSDRAIPTPHVPFRGSPGISYFLP